MFENVFKLLKLKFFFFTFLTQGGGRGGVHNSLSRKIPIFLINLFFQGLKILQ